MWNFTSCFSPNFALKNLFLFFFIVAFSSPALADGRSSNRRKIDFGHLQTWEEFKEKALQQDAQDESEGSAYLISGSLLTVAGLVGYQNTQNSVEKIAYSVFQSIGILGIGYGAELRSTTRDSVMFYYSIEGVPSLSLEQKNQLAAGYSNMWQKNHDNARIVKIVTHLVAGTLSVYNGQREKGELGQALTLLGGIHLFAALSIGLDF